MTKQEMKKFIIKNIKFYEEQILKFEDNDKRKEYWKGRLTSYYEILRCCYNIEKIELKN